MNPRSPRPCYQRKPITGFSAKSARELLFKARNVKGLKVMVTLTYPADFPTDGRLVKQHWRLLRQRLTRRQLSGLWWLEFQARGAAHIHIYLTGRVDKDWLSNAWYEIVGSGDPKHRAAGTSVAAIRKPHAVAAYAAKYARKMEQKEVPSEYTSVGRFWGLFGGLKVEAEVLRDGELSEVAEVIRTIRKLERARSGLGARDRRKDRGHGSFTSFGTAPAIKQYCSWTPRC